MSIKHLLPFLSILACPTTGYRRQSVYQPLTTLTDYTKRVVGLVDTAKHLTNQKSSHVTNIYGETVKSTRYTVLLDICEACETAINQIKMTDDSRQWFERKRQWAMEQLKEMNLIEVVA